MPIQTIVGDPELIRTRKQADSVLSRIIAYEREGNCKCGVLWRFHNQFGGLYEITSEEEAEDFMNNPTACERAIWFYDRSLFEYLKNTLKDKYDEFDEERY